MIATATATFPLRLVRKGEYEGDKTINGTRIVMNADRSMWDNTSWSLHAWTVTIDADGIERYTLIHHSNSWSLTACREKATEIADRY